MLVNRTEWADPPRPKRSRGYSLIEVIVAISVVVVGLLGVFHLMTTNLLTNMDARNRAVATHFAERQLEAARSVPFALVTSQAAAASPDLADLGPSATWERTVTPVGGSTTMSGVAITVRWLHQGHPQALTLTTLINRDGINAIGGP
ncbi:MAG: prepilin-type N-terminal cleavage/methylation domain-containing protein [Armatimonadetes bacterium]|nr:prepilin-type N-terminal cleavage/methylation domain-containing protein [Armatimonadota bacterium]